MCEEDEQNEQRECQHPCHPDNPCPECEPYWERMRSEGLWVDGQGWTEAARREWFKSG